MPKRTPKTDRPKLRALRARARHMLLSALGGVSREEFEQAARDTHHRIQRCEDQVWKCIAVSESKDDAIQSIGMRTRVLEHRCPPGGWVERILREQKAVDKTLDEVLTQVLNIASEREPLAEHILRLDKRLGAHDVNAAYYVRRDELANRLAELETHVDDVAGLQDWFRKTHSKAHGAT